MGGRVNFALCAGIASMQGPHILKSMLRSASSPITHLSSKFPPAACGQHKKAERDGVGGSRHPSKIASAPVTVFGLLLLGKIQNLLNSFKISRYIGFFSICSWRVPVVCLPCLVVWLFLSAGQVSAELFNSSPILGHPRVKSIEYVYGHIGAQSAFHLLSHLCHFGGKDFSQAGSGDFSISISLSKHNDGLCEYGNKLKGGDNHYCPSSSRYASVDLYVLLLLLSSFFSFCIGFGGAYVFAVLDRRMIGLVIMSLGILLFSGAMLRWMLAPI